MGENVKDERMPDFLGESFVIRIDRRYCEDARLDKTFSDEKKVLYADHRLRSKVFDDFELENLTPVADVLIGAYRDGWNAGFAEAERQERIRMDDSANVDPATISKEETAE